ncbi:nitroreductase [Afipia sp. GAS231]|uniref:nitroreductase n=1 Tax=Afipia sp. GAS231 TaxID=1882747 RepID=UPI00087B3B4A|nr:nitroreductase [Afipia sp. GAS231]SDO10444.1 Nitroreductase [Afipia sp. GAS231]
MSSVERKVAVPAASRGDDDFRREAVDSVIKQRFASRAFSSRPVSKQTVEDILDVARFAPSGANIQPWRAYVLAGAEKDNVSRALLKAHHEARHQHQSEYQYYAPQLPEPYLSRREQFGRLFYGALGIAQSDQAGRAGQTAKNYLFFGAPLGLIFTIDRRLQIGSWLDLGMFVQNVMLAAGARGLQTCPQETFAKYHAVLRELLQIPDEEMVVCGMSLGFAEQALANAGSLMPKAPVGEFAKFIGFDG